MSFPGLEFLHPALDYGPALLHQYDAGLVILSYLIAVMASSTGLIIGEYVRRDLAPRARILWLLLGAAVMGLAITSTYYVGMQAVSFFVLEFPIDVIPGMQTNRLAIFVSVIALVVIGMAITAAVLSRRFAERKMLRQVHAELEKRTVALEMSEARLAEAQRIAKVGSWEINLITNEVSWSAETYRMFGEDPATFKASSEVFLAKVHPDDRQVVSELRGIALETRGRPVEFEYRLPQADGSMRMMSTRAELECDAAGRPLRLIGTSLDVTERKKTDEALLESEAKYRMIADTAHEGIWVLDAEHKITFVNRRMAEILGYRTEYLMGKSSFEFLSDDARKEVERRMVRRRKGVSEQYDICLIHKDGSDVWVSLSAAPIKDGAGNYSGSLTMVSDLTSRRKLEEQLSQAQKMEAVGQLTGGIAHDFNNLLAVIIGNLEMLEEDSKDDEESSALIVAALDAGFRGADLIRRLLAFSRQQLLIPKVIAINKLVSDIEPMLKRVLGDLVSLTTTDTDDLWLSEVDPGQLANSVVNLCINARDAMPTGGRLILETSNCNLTDADVAGEAEMIAGEYVLLRVCDNGTGMKKEILQHIFEPFYTTKEVGKGSGLGLSMVYGFVKQSNGYINIESEEGQGTTIRIYLPRSESDHEDTGATAVESSRIPTGSETILLVENDIAVRKVAVALLRALGYRLLEAGSGAAALAVMLEHKNIDLVFSDIMMPGGMTGIDLAAHLHEHYPQVKVLLTSGHADAASFDDNFRFSGDDILDKPYQKSHLAQAVREVLDRR